MARTSLTEAKLELFNLVRDAPVEVDHRLDYDPGLDKLHGAVTVTVTTAGIGPDFWTFAIRLYANLSSQPREVQLRLDELMPAIADAVSPRFGPEAWVANRHPDAPHVFVCEWLVECGREDE